MKITTDITPLVSEKLKETTDRMVALMDKGLTMGQAAAQVQREMLQARLDALPHGPLEDDGKCDDCVIGVDEHYGKVYYESKGIRKSENGDTLEFVFCPMCGQRLEEKK